MKDRLKSPGVGLSLSAVLALSVFVFACSSPDQQGISNLSEAVASGDPDTVRDFIEESQSLDEPLELGLTPLMRAVNRDDVGIAEILIEAGADPNSEGSGGLTPALISARSNSTASLRLLLGVGADPAHRSANGMNALDHAADAGAAAAIEVLVSETDLGIDEPSESVTQGHGYPRDLGPTPLGLAVRAERMEAIRTLLELGADVNAPSASGHTPVLLAVFFDVSPEMVRVLVESGADLEARAECGQGCSVGIESLTVSEWALELNRDRLLPLLEG